MLRLILLVIGILILVEGIFLLLFNDYVWKIFKELSKDRKIVKEIALIEIVIAVLLLVVSFFV